MKRVLISIIICLIIAGCGDRAPEPIHDFTVVIANDPRLPAVAPEQIKQALDRAAEWIKIAYNRDVTFTIRGTENIDSYVRARITGLYLPPSMDQRYRFESDDTVERFDWRRNSLFHHYPFEKLYHYVPLELKNQLGATEPEIVWQLFAYYQDMIKYWKRILLPDGLPLLNLAHPEKYSVWWWTLMFESQFPEEITDHLIITNIPLLDDHMGTIAPHSLIRGGMLNGITWLETPQCVISTFLFCSDIPEITQYRDRELTEADKNRLLSHIIVHELGAHYLELIKDTYDHTNCFAVPTPYFNYGQTLDSIRDIKPCDQSHSRFDRDAELKRRYLFLHDYNQDSKQPERAARAAARFRELEKHQPE